MSCYSKISAKEEELNILIVQWHQCHGRHFFLEQLKAGLGLGWDASIRIWIGHQHTDRAPA